MRPISIVLGALAIAILLPVSALPLAPPIGKVIKSAPTIRASGSAGNRVLGADSDIFQLDRISTNGSGTGEFEFSDGTRLAVGPSASIVLDDLVYKQKNTYQKLVLKPIGGTFRWISGKSPSAAYQLRTPLGTLGIRGTALDITIRNGKLHMALLSGSARFCRGQVCKTLNRSCDYVSVSGGSISDPKPLAAAVTSRREAERLFPYIANPNRLSPRLRVGGSSCLQKVAIRNATKRQQTATAEAPTTTPSSPAPDVDPPDPPAGNPGPPSHGCDGNCGQGKGKGGGNGTENEGQGKGKNK